MDRIAGKESGYPAIPHHSMRRQSGAALIAMVLAACVILCASEAGAQCSARDVLRNRLTLRTLPSANTTPVPIKSAFAVPAWRTITIGTFANSFALLNALDAAGCSIGGLAEEFSPARPLPSAPRKQSWSFLRCRRSNSAFRPIPRAWRIFMHALNNWVSGLRQRRSLRNSGCNFVTSRWVNF